MSSKQKQFDAYLAALQAAIQKAQQPSPYETALMGDWQNTRNFLDSKDYRNLPKGVNVDLLPLSDYKRMQSYGQPGGGTVAQGGANAMAYRNQQDLSNNEITRDWGQAYEQKVGGLMDRNAALANGLQSSYANRMNAGVTGANSVLQAFGQRPQGFNWGSLLGGFAQQGVGKALSFI